MKTVQSQVAMAELLPMIEESFRQGMTVTLGVTGNSMLPLFRHGRDSVILSACDPTALRRGDVPLYRRPDGRFILHRILWVKKDTYTLVGDAQQELERGLPKNCVLAVMTGFVRKGKTVSCRNVWYRLYSALWMMVRPIRPFLIRVGSRMWRWWKREGK